MKSFLDWLGSPFIYRSPKPIDSFRHFLLYLPSRKLKVLAGTSSHLSKEKLVNLIINDSCLMNKELI